MDRGPSSSAAVPGSHGPGFRAGAWNGAIVPMLCCTLAWAMAGAVLMLAPGAGAGTIGPEIRIPASAGKQCVAPVPVMRRDHMRFLLHQRDATVHEGIRSRRFSLNNCIDCHANHNAAGDAISVNAPGEFCESCHRFAGVRMDCFGCHATTPGQQRRAAE